VIGSIQDNIYKLKYFQGIEKIWFYVDSAIEDWNIETGENSANIISDFLQQEQISTNLIFSEELKFKNEKQNKITAFKVNSRAAFFTDNNLYRSLKPVCQIMLTNHEYIIFYAENFVNSFAQNWGDTEAAYYSMRRDDSVLDSLENMELSLLDKDTHEVKFENFISFNSTQLAKNLLKIDFENFLSSNLSERSFEITYSDRYLKSPFSCLLFIQFIKGLSEELKFDIVSLTVAVSSFFNERQPQKITHNFLDSNMRNKAIKKYAMKNNFDSIIINTVSKNDLPHYRFFEFRDTNSNRKVYIRPDGGVEHGWSCYSSKDPHSLVGDEKLVINKSVPYPILYTFAKE
jgi:hypothetical protein